jgi:hypothetical protein
MHFLPKRPWFHLRLGTWFVLVVSASLSLADEPQSGAKPWGAGCNDALLAGPFAIDHAPDFKVSASKATHIKEVIDEVRGGNGGTLVVSPPDATIDSPAFLAHYLRAFSQPDTLDGYAYNFERILARLSRATAVLEDARLDWDVWRAYLLFEKVLTGDVHGIDYSSKEGAQTYIQSVESPKDLLWTYLSANAERLASDSVRRRWWIEHLLDGVQSPGGRPLRRWYLLELIAATDQKTSALVAAVRRDESMRALFQPGPRNPFVILSRVLRGAEEPTSQPPFAEAVRSIAASQKLSFEIWGIDPQAMPETSAIELDLGGSSSVMVPAVVLSQESWSDRPHYYLIDLSRPDGASSVFFNVRLPHRPSTDGVFFFTYDARLYVWPKARMDDAVVRMLHVSKLIDDEQYAQLLAAGFEKLDRAEPPR